MGGIDVLAVVGTCGSERTRYAALLAAVADRSLFRASRLGLSPSPLGEALALVPWTDRPAGAVVEFPGAVHPAAMIRALTSERSGVHLTGIVCVVDAVHLLDERIERGEFGTVLRSSGLCRLATRPGITTEWSHVGCMFSLEPMGSDEQIARFGDSLTLGQDLAFIGLDLDTAGLAAALDETALTDEEFEAGAAEWSRCPDPFPLWQEIAGGSD
jgi:hypothetical protein